MSKSEAQYQRQFNQMKDDPGAYGCRWYPYLQTMTLPNFIKYMKIFEQIDRDHSNTLELSELKRAKLLDNETKLPSHTLERLLKTFILDDDNDSICAIEFMGMASFITQCSEVFEKKDADKSNSLELSECINGGFDFICEGITQTSIEILFELNGVQMKGKSERSLNRVQFVGCCAYLGQCCSIFQKTVQIDRKTLMMEKKESFTKFIEMILIIARKDV